MDNSTFKIELNSIYWIDPEEQFDLCAHGKVRITIGNEIVVDNSDDPNDWWSLTASALHLLRTLEMNHTFDNRVGDCLIPGEGHVIDHLEGDPIVHIETVYPSVEGGDWWVLHLSNEVKLVSYQGTETIVPFEKYKKEVLAFVDQVEDFYEKSSPKSLPKNYYEIEGYLKLWAEWKARRNKWN